MYTWTTSERSLIKSATTVHQLGDILNGALERTRDPYPALQLWYNYTVVSGEHSNHPWYSNILDSAKSVLDHKSTDLDHINYTKMRSAKQSTFALVLPYEILNLVANMKFLYTGYQVPLEQGRADLLC